MKPAEPIGEPDHPGVYIREEMEARGWRQRDLAFVLGSTEQAMNLLLSGKRGVSADMAKALGKAFDVSPALFLNLQRAYDLAQAPEADPGIARRAALQSSYPLREMIRRKWIQDGDADELEAQMARFFEVANSNELPSLPHAARKTRYDETPPLQLAWLARVRQIARSMKRVKTYSAKALSEALPRLRALMKDPEQVRLVPEILAACGVRLVIVEALPGAKIDGACLWLDGKMPVIGLSLRHDRIDNFWFVLRHEIEHVLKGDGKTHEIIDVDLEGADPKALPAHETAANAASAAFSLPQGEMDRFVLAKSPFFSERDILALAARHDVHPGIVVGQIQKRTERWTLLRKHLVKIREHILPVAIVDGWGAVARVKA